MDIQSLSSTYIKISLTRAETEDLGISFETFEKENEETKAFLTYTLAVLKEMELVQVNNSAISVEVYEQKDKSLIIYISTDKNTNHTDLSIKNCFGIVSNNPVSFFECCKDIKKKLNDNISSAEIYEFSNKYILIIYVTCNKLTALKILEKMPNKISSITKISKIKEYGKLISDSPFKLFI